MGVASWTGTVGHNRVRNGGRVSGADIKPPVGFRAIAGTPVGPLRAVAAVGLSPLRAYVVRRRAGVLDGDDSCPI